MDDSRTLGAGPGAVSAAVDAAVSGGTPQHTIPTESQDTMFIDDHIMKQMTLPRYVTTVLIIITVPLTLFPSCLLLLGPLTVSTVSVYVFVFAGSSVPETDVLFLLQEFSLRNPTSSTTVARRSTVLLPPQIESWQTS